MAPKQARKDRQRRHTKTDPSRRPNKNHPRGEESTATQGCQTGGGSEKGHAIRSHKATRPVRAEHQPVPRENKPGVQNQTKGETRAGRSKEGEKGRGGVIATSFFVWYIRDNVVYQIEASHSNYCRLRRKQDAALPALQHEAAVRCTCPERLLDHHLAFSFVVSDLEILVLAHVA